MNKHKIRKDILKYENALLNAKIVCIPSLARLQEYCQENAYIPEWDYYVILKAYYDRLLKGGEK